jgi:uncharacterized protein (TIGR00299 family) protein
MTRRVLYVDPIGGAAGDMLLAALIDAGAPLEAIRSDVDAVLPGRMRIDTEIVRRGGLRARLLSIDTMRASPRPEARPFGELAAALDAADLRPAVKERARSVIDRLGHAEARVHGMQQVDLSLHELGDDDTLLDVVGVASALEGLGVRVIMVSTIPLSAPGPATLELLRGFAVRGAGSGETVTPTAAAIFAGLGAPAERFPDMTIDAVGYGAGSRDPSDGPNVVRVLVGTRTDAEGDRPRERDLVVLEANLDDLTPELVADAAQALLSAGALDVWTVPAQMKKGRLGVVLSALGDREAEAGLRQVFFEATSTLGVRAHPVRRWELERRMVTVPVGEASIRVKVGMLGGRVVTATPEHDDVARAAAAAGRSVRALYDQAAAAAQALRLTASREPEA